MFTAARGGFNYYSSSANDPYWTSVSLLNNWETPQTSFTDSSNNNFPLSITGTVTPNLRTPFVSGAGGSQYYNSSSFLSIADSSQFTMTGDFTMEAWVYLTVNSTRRSIITHWPGVIATICSFAWEIFNNNKIYFSYGIGSFNGFYASTNTLNINTWYHVAVSRSGTTFRCFINGVVEPNTLTMSGSLNDGTGPIEVGAMPTEGNFMSGFISNLRVLKGTCLYTGNFTVPTSPLTNIANTSLLINSTNQGQQNSNAVIDQGPNALTVTSSSTGLKSSGLSPFGNTYPGSIYIGGAGGSYPTVATNAAFTYSTGNFTIECWVKTVVTNVQQYIIDQRNSGTANAIIPTLYFNSSNQLVYFVSNAARITGTTAITSGVWYHVAVSRSGTSTKMFLNGVQEGSTYSDSNNYAASRVSIGTSGTSNGTNTIDGYISNVRLSKGFAYYTTTFTPSTTPLTSDATYTSLLTCTGTMALYDLSSYGCVMNQTGTAITQTSVYKFGTSSGQYSGSNFNYYSDDAQFYFSTLDFTIEGWVYRNSSGAAHGLICKGSTTTGWALTINSSNQLVWTSASTNLKTSTTTIPATTWTYFAITRSGTTGYMFINGTQEGSTFTDNSNYTITNPLYLGNDRSVSTSGLNGYLDDIRITRGVCRYTASFTAPTSAFPTS